MATLRMGQPIGLTDQLLRDIHVGDLLIDSNGVEYTVDRYGRAVPTQGGNCVPIRQLRGCEIKEAWTPAPKPEAKPASEEKTEEEKQIELIEKFIRASGDQRLVDELRGRGYTVTCTKIAQNIVIEEVQL